jgi:tetratricopeptide (TPR) repeat protein
MRLLKLFLTLSLLISFFSTSYSEAVTKAAQIPFKKALEFNGHGDYVSALNSFIEAYNLDAAILGLDNEGILDNSTKFFQRYLQNNPKDLNSLMWLGSIHSLTGDIKTAIEYYQKVTMFSPNSEEAKEADTEIISLEKLLRSNQNTEETKVVDAQKEAANLDRMKVNVTREVKQEYEAAISKLGEQITTLEESVSKAQQEATNAKKEVEDTKAKFGAIEAELKKYKFLYRKYRRKSGSNF